MIIILITLDCVRKDKFNKENAPEFFNICKDFVSFENCFSQSQNTLSSHWTIFTSKYLFQHKVYSNYSKVFPLEFSLDRVLKRNGFENKAICGISFLAKSLGNLIGKEDREFKERRLKLFRILKIHKERRKASDVFNKAIKEIERTKNRDFFLWLHLFDAHMPYYSPKRFKNFEKVKCEKSILTQISEKGWFSPYFKEYEEKVTLDYFVKTYESSIRYIDYEMKRFFDYLKYKNIYNEALIIVTSDHGECLYGEHSIYCAHKKLFDETTHCPLFIKFSKGLIKNEKVYELVEHTDISPTVLSHIGIEENNYEGIDLTKLMRGKVKIRNFVFSEHVDDFMKAIRDENYIYAEINEGKENKWNMPLEKGNLFKRDGTPLEDREIEEKMKRMMEQFLNERDYKKEKELSTSQDLGEEIEKQLKSLGYL